MIKFSKEKILLFHQLITQETGGRQDEQSNHNGGDPFHVQVNGVQKNGNRMRSIMSFRA